MHLQYLPPKILLNLCFSFLLGQVAGSWVKITQGYCKILTQIWELKRVLQPFQEKLKTILILNFGGQIGCIMGNVEVAYMPILKKVLSFKTVAIFIPDW